MPLGGCSPSSALLAAAASRAGVLRSVRAGVVACCGPRESGAGDVGAPEDAGVGSTCAEIAD